MRKNGGAIRGRRFDPLWNSLVVGGVGADGKPFLGTVGMIGTAFTDDHVATGAAAAPATRCPETYLQNKRSPKPVPNPPVNG